MTNRTRFGADIFLMCQKLWRKSKAMVRVRLLQTTFLSFLVTKPTHTHTHLITIWNDQNNEIIAHRAAESGSQTLTSEFFPPKLTRKFSCGLFCYSPLTAISLLLLLLILHSLFSFLSILLFTFLFHCSYRVFSPLAYCPRLLSLLFPVSPY